MGGDGLAETYEDYGDYSEELLYQEKSTLGKIFSFRTLKKLLKFFALAIVVLVYGLLFFRLCSGKPPKAFSGLIRTQTTVEACAASNGNLAVYSQDPVEHMAKDGYFSLYDVLYIPQAKQIEFTIRYNNSSTEALRTSLEKKETEARRSSIRDRLKKENGELSTSALDKLVEEELASSLLSDPIEIELSKTPFVFLLRDDMGRIYTKYAYLKGEKTVYQYLRVVFDDVDLFGGAQTAPDHAYPTPSVDNPAYIYKGANAGTRDAISYLYVDMYYENAVDLYGESFAYPLVVYRSETEMEPYSYAADEMVNSVTEGLTYVDLGE